MSIKNLVYLLYVSFHLLSFMSISSVQNPIFRSVAESRLSTELLAKEGQWDASNKAFCTRERQLQERSRTFQKLHQELRYSTVDAFEEQGKDLDFRYPLCLKDVMKRKVSGSAAIEDPSSAEIERRRVLAAQNRMMQEKVGSTHLRELEADLEPFVVKPLTVHQERKIDPSTSASVVGPGLRFSDGIGSKILPPEKQVYSSKLVEMKRTKEQLVQNRNGRNTTIQSIMDLNATPELKTVITKIFANPEQADEISKAEHDRRERAFEEDQMRAARQANMKLQEERMLVEKELSHIKI